MWEREEEEEDKEEVEGRRTRKKEDEEDKEVEGEEGRKQEIRAIQMPPQCNTFNRSIKRKKDKIKHVFLSFFKPDSSPY